MGVFDVSARPQLDCETLVDDILKDRYGSGEFGDVVVQSDVWTDTAAVFAAKDARIIIYNVGTPANGTSNFDGDAWKFPLSLIVLGVDPDKAFSLVQDVHLYSASWPRIDVSDVGRVYRVDKPYFARIASSSQMNGKNVVEYAADMMVWARDKYDLH